MIGQVIVGVFNFFNLGNVIIYLIRHVIDIVGNTINF